MEFDDFDFEKIDKEAQQQCLAKYAGKWIKCSILDYYGDWDVNIVHVVGVFTIHHDLKLVYQYFGGDIDYISVKKIEEQDKPGEIYFTVLDDEMAKSELANRYKVNQIL